MEKLALLIELAEGGKQEHESGRQKHETDNRRKESVQIVLVSGKILLGHTETISAEDNLHAEHQNQNDSSDHRYASFVYLR